MAKTNGVPTSRKVINRRSQHNGSVVFEYYTDPLCCWSWAFEPVLDRILERYAGSLELRVIMGGLISDWNSFSDPMNDISRPSQMGPHWMHVSKTTGVEINTQIWLDNPPVSSCPACLAVKCAQSQSAAAGLLLLKELRKAVMVNGSDISRNAQILSLAADVFKDAAHFDRIKFKTDVLEGKGIEAFRKDLMLKEMNEVSRLPCIILKNATGNGRILFGYRPYEVMEEVLDDFLENHL